MENNEENKGPKETVEIDITRLKEVGLSSDQFLYILLRGIRGWSEEEVVRIAPMTVPYERERTKEILEENDWIKLVPDSDNLTYNVHPKDKFKKLYEEIVEKDTGRTARDVGLEEDFKELWGQFPIKVQGRDGEPRPLRTKQENTRTYRKALQHYKAARKEYTHQFILRCLKAELKMRRDYNKFRYMRQIETWLARREFEYFEDLLDQYSDEDLGMWNSGQEEAKGDAGGYGEKLI